METRGPQSWGMPDVGGANSPHLRGTLSGSALRDLLGGLVKKTLKDKFSVQELKEQKEKHGK